MKTPHKMPGDRTVLLIAFIICVLVLGSLMLRKYESSRQRPAVPPQTQRQGTHLVTLFFASPDGVNLMREGREIDACSETADCVKDVVGELVNGPMGNLTPTIPPTATINDVKIDGDKLLIDMGNDFAKGLPGGSNSEMLAVYSIIDSVAANFPSIKKVQFLIDGKPVESLNGHLDLREPLEPDFSLEKWDRG